MANKSFNVRVEYEPAWIRGMVVQCPFCDRWFLGGDISLHDVNRNFEINMTPYFCPICEKEFGGERDWNVNIKEIADPEVGVKVYRQKWVTDEEE